MDEVITILQKARTEKFWGQIQVDIQSGQIILIRRTETIKPKENTLGNDHRTRGCSL